MTDTYFDTWFMEHSIKTEDLHLLHLNIYLKSQDDNYHIRLLIAINHFNTHEYMYLIFQCFDSILNVFKFNFLFFLFLIIYLSMLVAPNPYPR